MTNTYSINLTVFNKDILLDDSLDRIKRYTTGSYEIVIVLDACIDRSELIATNFKKQNPQIPIKILYANNWFETKCNNLAARNSCGDYIVIVQDDMLVNEPGWNERLAKPTKAFNDVFAVTARTAHNWVYNSNNQHENTTDLDNCWCDVLNHTEHANRSNTNRETFAIRDSVNRGPLLIKHEILQKLNYFDEIFAPQEMDDHDLCYRAFKLGLVAGCYWIDYICDDKWGGSRINGNPAPWSLKANHKNVKIIWKRHKDAILGPKHNESRLLT